jgi:hypothetical protein
VLAERLVHKITSISGKMRKRLAFGEDGDAEP